MSLSPVEKALEVYRTGGVSSLVSRAIEATVLDRTETPRRVQQVGEQLYRRSHQRDITKYDGSIDPYQVHFIPVEAIERMTGRPYPAWKGWRNDIGSVWSGEWDQPTTVDDLPISDDQPYSYTPPELYHRVRFEETPIHQALEQHFDDGVGWMDIPLIQRFLDLAELGDGPVWGGCQSPLMVRERCAYLDDLYEQIQSEGYQSQRELGRQSGGNGWFLRNITNEVRIDIARNGSPLFVDGRHRVSIAKLLNIERIPAVVIVRHAEHVTNKEEGM